MIVSLCVQLSEQKRNEKLQIKLFYVHFMLLLSTHRKPSNLHCGSCNHRPQRSCEGYVFTRVCHSVHGGGCLVLGGLLRGGLLQGGVASQHALRQTPPPRETATAADGSHPTGMHSCLNYYFSSGNLSQVQFPFGDSRSGICTTLFLYEFIQHLICISG